MPQIQAFHGLRYDLGHVGNLSDVIAPPYDVINADFQEELYKRHPANVVRLILNRAEPGDVDDDDRYQRAARFLKNWRNEGVLQSEPVAAIYVYHQQFEHLGETVTRRGFMCRVRLERFGEGNIFPHEETHAAAKADRLKLINACRANLSQIFGLFPDPENIAQNLLENAIIGVAPLEAKDHLNVVHRLWPVTDVQVIADASAAMSNLPVYIADGHHRYETACDYRDQVAGEGELDDGHPANHVLMMCVGMSDPGMVVLPTHRLFRGLAALTSGELAERLSSCFDLSAGGAGIDPVESIWSDMEAAGEQTTIALYTTKDGQWTIARLNENGRSKMAELASDHSQDWQGLGVSILHRLIVEHLLDGANAPKPKYVHDVPEVVAGLLDGDDVGRDATGQEGHGGDFPLAALVMPATLEHIQQISQHNERMPAKSTYFYPKLLSGLVINPVD